MTGDLFSGWNHTLKRDHVKPARPVIRKGTRVKVIASDGADPHGAEIGALGTAVAKVNGIAGESDMWREDGSHYYIVELDSRIMEGAQAGKTEVLFWPEEIERDD